MPTSRECVDHIIPLSEQYLRLVLREYVNHYNATRSSTDSIIAISERLPDVIEFVVAQAMCGQSSRMLILDPGTWGRVLGDSS